MWLGTVTGVLVGLLVVLINTVSNNHHRLSDKTSSLSQEVCVGGFNQPKKEDQVCERN